MKSHEEEAAGPGVLLAYINIGNIGTVSPGGVMGRMSWNEMLQGPITELQLLMSPPETPPGIQSAAMG